MIRHFAAPTAIFCSVISSHAGELDAGDKAALMVRTEVMVEAFRKGDTDTVLRMTHPCIYALAGGKGPFEEATRKGMAFLKENGMEVRESKLGQPTRTWQAGENTVCFIPVTSIFWMKGSKIQSTGFYIAIKGGAVTDWLFLDSAGLRQRPDLLKQLLPGLPDDVVLPENRQENLPDDSEEIPEEPAGRLPGDGSDDDGMEDDEAMEEADATEDDASEDDDEE